jgi:hypothetical protein
MARMIVNDPRLRKVAADRLLKKVIHPDGGPLMYHGSEEEQLSFDATCANSTGSSVNPGLDASPRTDHLQPQG